MEWESARAVAAECDRDVRTVLMTGGYLERLLGQTVAPAEVIAFLLRPAAVMQAARR